MIKVKQYYRTGKPFLPTQRYKVCSGCLERGAHFIGAESGYSVLPQFLNTSKLGIVTRDDC